MDYVDEQTNGLNHTQQTVSNLYESMALDQLFQGLSVAYLWALTFSVIH